MSVTEPLRTSRLTLTPLAVADAREMVDVLADPTLYTFTGGEAPTLAQLEDRYRHQSAGSPRSGEIWHNWILRLDGTAIGFVQATVEGAGAELAWVVGTPWQGSGFGTEASRERRSCTLLARLRQQAPETDFYSRARRRQGIPPG